MYDVLIVGSGPAGSTAAKMLSENGFSVILAEKFGLPRYKSCSGMLIKKSADLVGEYFGANIPEDVMCTPVDNYGMVFTDDKGKEYKFEQTGFNVWRSTFDNWLVTMAKKCGTDVRDKTAVLFLENRDGYVSATLKSERTYTVDAKYVVDCEGVVGTLKRRLTGVRPDYITTFQTFNKGTIELDWHYFYAYLQPELSEYDAWFNVKDDMLVLGVAVKNVHKIADYYDKFIKYMKKKHKLHIDSEVKREKWLMPQIHKGCNIDYGVGRVLFAGEIAGFLNPMGEGISAGIESGCCAARALMDNFNDLDDVYESYRMSTAPLKNYIERQWKLVAEMTDTFSYMK